MRRSDQFYILSVEAEGLPFFFFCTVASEDRATQGTANCKKQTNKQTTKLSAVEQIMTCAGDNERARKRAVVVTKIYDLWW